MVTTLDVYGHLGILRGIFILGIEEVVRRGKYSAKANQLTRLSLNNVWPLHPKAVHPEIMPHGSLLDPPAARVYSAD